MKGIVKRICIDMQYGTPWQYNMHHNTLLCMLKAWKSSMEDGMNIQCANHKENKVLYSGDCFFDVDIFDREENPIDLREKS